MVTEVGQGLSFFNEEYSEEDLKHALGVPTDTRLYQVLQAFRQGYDIDFVHDITKIDKWFLYNSLRSFEMKMKSKELWVTLNIR